MRIGNVQTIPDVWARARILWNAIHQWRRSKCIPEKNRFVREFSSEAWLELTTILQLTQLKILRVGDVLVRGQEEDDVALLVLDRDNVEQTVERASCFTIKNYKSLWPSKRENLLFSLPPFFFPFFFRSPKINSEKRNSTYYWKHEQTLMQT